MKKAEKSVSNSFVYGVLIFLVFLFGVSAQILTNINCDSDIVGLIEYTEASTVDYQVYYKENPFYNDEFIPAGKIYVEDYIDKINATFSYDVNYNDKLTRGDYEYYVRAKIIAYTPDAEDEDLWTKEYKLSEVEAVSVNKDSNYHLAKSIDIDYNKFKNDFETFRVTTGVNAVAKLVVELVINNYGEYPNLGDFKYGATLKLEMPLGDSTFKIKTISSTNDDAHKIAKFNEDDHEKMFVKVIIVLLWILAIFTVIILIVVFKINRNKLSFYERTLRRILLTHDSIIVNVEELPSLSSLSVVNVTSFDELLDAQSEVRLPINFKENKRKRNAKFVLVHDNLAWVYTLDEENMLEDTL